EPKLRREDDAVADGRERLAHDALVDERSVCLGRVEEGDAEVDGVADDGDGPGGVGRRAVAEAEAHAAVADGRHVQRFPEGALPHFVSLWYDETARSGAGSGLPVRALTVRGAW